VRAITPTTLAQNTHQDESPSPVGETHSSLSEWSGGQTENFRTEDPRSSVPSCRVEDGPKVEEEEGSSSVSGDSTGSGGCWFLDGDVDGNAEHGSSSSNGTSHQDLSPSESVNHVENPNESTDSLDDTEDTRR